MKIVYFGEGEFGAECLEYILSAGRNVIQVYTTSLSSDNQCDIQKIANKYNLKLSIISSKDTLFIKDKLMSLKPELIVSVSWKGIFKQSILDIPTIGAINLHGSLLPKYRGNAPVTWAIINGETETGASVHFMDEGMDTGDIIEQIQIPISIEDTVGTVLKRLLEADGPLLEAALKNLEDPDFKGTPQNHAQATIGKKRTSDDGEIDWSWSTKKIYDWVRAQTKPLPGAFSTINGNRLNIWSVSIAPNKTDKKFIPGQITGLSNAILPLIQAGDGIIIIHEANLMVKGQNISLFDMLEQDDLNIGIVLGRTHK